MEKKYTLRAICDLTGQDVAKINNLIHQYHLPTIKQPHQRNQYRKSDVDKLMHHLKIEKTGIKPNTAQKLLKLKGSIIYQWLKDGVIQATDLNGRKYFTPEQFEALKQYAKQYQKHIYQAYTLKELAQKYQVSPRNIQQMLKKAGINAKENEPINVETIRPWLKNIQSKPQLLRVNHHFPTDGKNPPQNESDRIYLRDFAKELKIPYATLYNLVYHNYLDAYKDKSRSTNRLFISQKTATWVKQNYKQYPKGPLYTPKEASQKLNLTVSQIHTLLYMHQQKLIHVFGDDKKYLDKATLEKVKQWRHEHIKRPGKKPYQLSINSKLVFQPDKGDLKPNQIANALKVSEHMVLNWCKANRVKHQYNQEKQLFFTPEDFKDIQKKYLNYPEIAMIDQTSIQAFIKPYNVTLPTVLKHLNLTATKVLGDNRNLYTKAKAAQIKKYVKDNYIMD